jgi:hypothetical protein
VLAGEHAPGAAEAGEHLVGDERHVPRAERRRAHPAQELRRVDQHAAGALHHRLDEHRRDALPFALEDLLHRPRAALRHGPPTATPGSSKQRGACARRTAQNSGAKTAWKEATPPTAIAPKVSPW